MSQHRYRMPQGLDTSVEDELARLGSDDATMEVTRHWESAVGPEIARNAWPARMKRDGTLVVHARTSVWAFELTQMAEEIRARLEPRPEEIRFIVGRVPEPVGPPPDEPAKGLTEACPQALDQATTLAAEMASDEVREALQRAASLGLSRRRSDRSL